MSNSDDSLPEFARGAINLASPRLGTRVVAASDEFFGAKERLIKDEAPVFLPGEFDANGKWMDGWETRRRRHGGNDHCIVRLGAPGTVVGVEIDTHYFTGNFPPEASIEGALCDGEPDESTSWRPVVPRSPLAGDRRQFFQATGQGPFSHLRLQMFPDGGIARLRVFGRVVRDWSQVPADAVVDLAAVGNGAYVVGYNDAHYGDPWVILTEGRGKNMGDGWETRRRRTPGHDWIVVALGTAGRVERVVVDTANFRGNYPDACSLQGARIADPSRAAVLGDGVAWTQIMAPQKLAADSIHTFEAPAVACGQAVSHVRLNIYPDGGVSRLRVFGRRADD